MAVDLMSILPTHFRPIMEFKQIINSDEKALEKLDESIRSVWNNFYIQTADEKTISLYEAQFGIVPTPIDTLDYRRERLLQKYNTIVPFSIDFLRNRLTELFGDNYSLAVNSVACTLIISVTSPRHGAVDLLYDLLWDVVPAHMDIIANQQVNNVISGDICSGGTISSTFIQTI